jgi:peptidoglycan/xylan/chitin deacetylase (PgdA/CDA1 family)
MYHSIGTTPGPVKNPGLYVAPRMFRFQMWYLKIAGFRVVPLRDILAFLAGEHRGENLVALTFDDGYRNFLDNAYPVLKARGYPSTVFIISDLTGKENIWVHRSPRFRERLLDWNDIIHLSRNGVDFGSHTRTHPSLIRLPLRDIEEEVQGSKDLIEERVQSSVDFFCYPYGEYNEEVLSAVRRAGYLGAVTTKRGYVYRDGNPFEINRVPIKLKTGYLSFMKRLHFRYRRKEGRGR